MTCVRSETERDLLTAFRASVYQYLGFMAAFRDSVCLNSGFLMALARQHLGPAEEFLLEYSLQPPKGEEGLSATLWMWS